MSLLRGLGRVILVLAGTFVLLVAVLVALLARGPIGLDFLRPHIERSLRAPDSSFAVHLPSLELGWDTGERQLELRAARVRVVGRAGRDIVEIPGLAVRLAGRALLYGRIVPAEVRLVEPRLTVVRALDGTLDLGLSAGGRTSNETLDVGAIIGQLAGAPGSGATTTSLRRVSAHGAEIAIVDQGSSQTWRLTHADLAFRAVAPGLIGDLTGRLEVAPHSVFIRAGARYRPGRDRGTVSIGFHRFSPEMLGDLPLWADAEAGRRAAAVLRMPLDGTVAVTVDSALRPIAARGHVRGGAGQVRAFGADSNPIDVSGLRLRGRLDVGTRHLQVQRLTVGLGSGRVHAVGGMSWAEDGGIGIEAATSAEHLAIDTLALFWPPTVAPGAWEWVMGRRSGGVFTTAALEIGAAIEGGSRKAAVRLRRGSGGFEGVSLRYHDSLPPATGMAGTARLDDRGWTLHANRGRIGAIELTGASAALPIGKAHEPRARVAAALSGPVPEALAILDREPFGWARALGVAPETVTGAMAAHLQIDAAMTGHRPVAVSGSARLTGLATNDIVGGLPLGDGDASLAFETGRVRVTGTARVAGTPITIDWSQDSTTAAGPTRKATVTGRFDAESRRRLGFDLTPWVDGPVDGEARLATSRGNGGVDVRLRLDDATISTGLGRLAKAGGTPSHAEAHLVLERNVVTGADRLLLEAGPTTVSGNATRGADGWDGGRLDAVVAGVSPGAEPGRCTLTLGRQQDGHRFRLTSEDAGALLRAVAGEGGLRNGLLVLEGTASPGGTGTEMTGTLEVRDTVLTGSTVLRRIAASGSLSSIERALTGSGLPFDRIAAALRYRDPTLTVADGIAHGSALAVTVDGTIDRRSATLDLRGTLIPSYFGLNTAPGRIPVVGRLMGRGDEKAIQAIDFTAAGPIDAPQVRASPMSAIAPGVLRDVLRKIRR